jgi:N6-L-threonylcarbamoyladenine synthase
MYVLGIETSCDETAAAVVKDGREVLSNVVSTSLRFHQKYGGVVPEIASRKQLETITAVVDDALAGAGVSLQKIGLISVTVGPGLLGSLLVGISFAKSLSLARRIPLLGVDHLHGHMYASFLSGHPRLPAVSLVVSGGHTNLYLVRDLDRIELLGSTLDDACGEAFDKVAKILKLGYPGGPIIEKIARRGNPSAIPFKCSGTKRPLDFSFSGIKTAVLYYVQKHRSGHLPLRPYDRRLACDIAASFQSAVFASLVEKSLYACRAKKVRCLVVGGGVAANQALRVTFLRRGQDVGVRVWFPTKEHCMDNAAMVAGVGYCMFRQGHRSDRSLNAALN